MHDGRSLRTSKHWTRHLPLTKIAMTIRLGRYRRTHKLVSCHVCLAASFKLFHKSIPCSYGHQSFITVNTKSQTGCYVKPYHLTLLPTNLYGTTVYVRHRPITCWNTIEFYTMTTACIYEFRTILRTMTIFFFTQNQPVGFVKGIADYSSIGATNLGEFWPAIARLRIETFKMKNSGYRRYTAAFKVHTIWKSFSHSSGEDYCSALILSK